MKVSDFDYRLPEELIAQDPWPDRDRSRLMVLDRKSRKIQHRSFYEIVDYLIPGDLLVINNTRVIPARLMGRKETGGVIEIFLLERVPGSDEKWECLIGGKRVRRGLRINISGSLAAEIGEPVGEGRFSVRFICDRPFETVLEETGQVPLPPYIKRVGDCPEFTDEAKRSRRIGTVPAVQDKDRYQTVFAKEKGAVAAPTAGLHFTETLLDKLKNAGIDIAPVTLHVGPGTFLPVKVERVEDHRMHPERYEINGPSAEKINRAKAERRRVIAVGSTSLRTLEAASNLISPIDDKGGAYGINAGNGSTSIFIYPGYTFRIVDALITNFHLPKSTLMMLVSAFADRDFIMKAYEEAIAKRYRFYSYGDAMLII